MTIKLLDLTNSIKILFKILILSVSSTKFYQTVYQKFTGYGFRYVLYVSLFVAFIQVGFALFNINQTYQFYFAKNHVAASNLEYVLNQVPEVNYKDGDITTNPEAIYKIHNKSQKTIFAIDSNNQLPFLEKNKTPVIFGKNKIFYPISKDATGQYQHWSTSYDSILGKDYNNLNSDEFVGKIKKQYEILPHLMIIFGLPFLTLAFCVVTGLKKLLLIFLIYLTTQFARSKFSLKTSTRMVMFTVGPELLAENIAIIFPIFSVVPIIAQFWLNSLLIIAIIQIQGKDK